VVSFQLGGVGLLVMVLQAEVEEDSEELSDDLMELDLPHAMLIRYSFLLRL
jgi:hypothetical protein